MKKIVFLTGTRADFGKLKSLIDKVEQSKEFHPHIFVTGMHMLKKYGFTVQEVEKCGFSNVYKYINQHSEDTMDVVLAKTISGLSDYVKEVEPDMIVVHGDRVEAMAGAIVGSLNNILVSHIEGGEVSGTIDELIRHSVSKMSHLHYVSNETAKSRLVQLGEAGETIHVIGSPDLDIMSSGHLPEFDDVIRHYDIPFDDYGVLMYHPVTTEVEQLRENITQVVDAIIESGKNFVVIFPNNDHGTDIIINEYNRFKSLDRIKVFPSVRFESFLTLLKHAKIVIGNSSAGVREAPFYGIPSLDIGTRQKDRATAESIINVDNSSTEILEALEREYANKYAAYREFGSGDSDKLFIESIASPKLWKTAKQKVFVDFSD
ncbi:UDP-N-acetylglucosamine 2-epimerase [Vibrio crassostreae]|uniref:UDP-N-acetylglucosamine 2-epimerase n=1 Tax=Vibrio crassostreae TaxID=246167 RepID=UPI00105156FD|nr:UDP-N-acetylglucosamine 2-epimerase [Vibrio crassostreae]TCN92811.1 UDP-N-acetylglucosamine 2-epimerase (hydrolysing) [Vibrio crassostreae]CAK1932357.1 UDP-N-acetylglucosamine 2-epimerase [Vibrio crassostreae]CAK1940613.1 UDP-N-acetylglucosamine 2-epimerase [Vibrio crassostreae]CAK1945964.1 UDP-N-acetylglucosamine 2-epimerase [Vibrio crassostreae]CAK2711346.1 UDP-N-acetylglucosamine 2-epimerase [Vibrio crassostreae]